jgi:hypothetical protein
MDTYPIIKYIFLLILYIFAFFCAYSEQIETTGLVSIFIIQCIFTICLLFDIFSDKNRNLKVLTLPSSSKLYSNEMSIPIFWFIIPIIGLQFREILTIVLEINKANKTYGSIKISRDNRVRLDRFKFLFLISILCIFSLTFIYINYKNISTTGSMQLAFVILVFAAVIVEVVNNINVTNISYQMQNTTDG